MSRSFSQVKLIPSSVAGAGARSVPAATITLPLGNKFAYSRTGWLDTLFRDQEHEENYSRWLRVSPRAIRAQTDDQSTGDMANPTMSEARA
jgi:hypothetical protein